MIAWLLLGLAQANPEPVEPVGLWINPQRSVAVEIQPCEPYREALCGYVRWASGQAIADAGKAGTTELVGSELMRDFLPIGQRKWRGRLFVPDLRKRSKAELRWLESGRIKITGCAAGKLLCRSQVWRRVSIDELPPQAPPGP